MRDEPAPPKGNRINGLEELIDRLSASGLEVKCPLCRKWTASFFDYGGYDFRCGGCRKPVRECRCEKMEDLVNRLERRSKQDVTNS